METQSDPVDDFRGKLSRCQELLGYKFSDETLLIEALTHASGAPHRLASNERMEFLGDSILGFIVCRLLFERFPDWNEGELTRVKSAAVSRSTCGRIGQALGISEFLLVGKGMGGHRTVPRSLQSNALESILAAIYLDGGLQAARAFIVPHLEEALESILAGQEEANYKSELQQLAQKRFGEAPMYKLLDEKGPDHSKCFLVCAVVSDSRFSPAWGNTKKQAEQRAACNALAELDGFHGKKSE